MTSRRWRVAWCGVFAFGFVLRVALFGGYGLGDDPGYFASYHGILRAGGIDPGEPYDFRFAFWIPVVASLRLFGVTEWAWVGFVTLCSLVNLVLVWALARQEWGDARTALAAMALMAVLPLDVLTSTLFVIDVPLATYCYAAFFCYREALRRERLWLAVAAGVFLFLGYSAKQWALLVGALFAIEAVSRLRRGWRITAACVGTMGGLIAGYFAWQWVRFGDPLYDVHLVRSIAIFLPHSRELVLDYSKMLWWPTEYGTWFAGWYPHLLILLGLAVVPRTPSAGKWLGFFLIELACLSAVPSHRENGQWVLLVPHIFRYLSFLAIPLVLALAGCWHELARRRRGIASAGLVGFLAWSVAQSVALTAPTRDAFAELRRAGALVQERFPDEVVVSDRDFLYRHSQLVAGPTFRARFIETETPEQQALELARVEDGVVVTGGARLPWYGCHRCTTTIAAFTPPATWRLVQAFDAAPLTLYRREPLRIWHVSASAARAEAELASAGRDPAARGALLRTLVGQGQMGVAIEVGRRLMDDAPPPDVGYWVGLACAGTGRLGCASSRLSNAIEGGLPPILRQTAIVRLVAVLVAQGRFDQARTWVARYRQEFPGAPAEVAFEDLESGMAEAVGLYHAGRYREAGQRFAAIVSSVPEASITSRRARYFRALSLFRQYDVEAAEREAEAYRARYGIDDSAIELEYRNAEARLTDPQTAARLFAALRAAHPNTVWATEATRHLQRLDPDAVREPGG